VRLPKYAIVSGLVLLTLLISQPAQASTIDFEDHPTRQNFFDLGIASTYEGYSWGYSHSAGPGGKVVPTTSQTGWAFQTIGNSAINPMPLGGSGVTSAWNWNGSQSLWIDFGAATNFSSGMFAILSTNYSLNASTVQLFGYNSSNVLVGSSSTLTLTSTFQTLNANFTGIHSLEIRSNADNQWFSVDDLVVNQTVPEPATYVTMMAGLGLIVFAVRRKQIQTQQ
jgi:hypothetical protein